MRQLPHLPTSPLPYLPHFIIHNSHTPHPTPHTPHPTSPLPNSQFPNSANHGKILDIASNLP
ncbi:MAG: hypothetical protein PX481_14065 [Microcystis sp. M53603_WE2]|uniref:hypothetical protein n=1 Tax=unclassified Microcystis TaxID=2643300 RepID=UPI000F78F553|nr:MULTISPECIES: hypothetical protein [unclassified Microcystis]MCZ8363945.1 hypothetical protein [Microcystis sp. LE19-251.1A]MDJ0528533.1 hypothetical protein [Microcystis sp. M53600_WE12]MCZ8024375.1 hypothetical protein [Microcystis sp. LE19-10.1B]MDJ0539786.1 hypothetical protein [Microcystis sp. M53603_WE2]MDJ0605275.1 hypothetical protein [Microcystis sp. M53602_WE12]